MKNESVFGICPSRIGAERTVEQLKSAGFENTEISVLLSSPAGSKEFSHQNSTKAPEGAATGTISGATIGGVLGWLAGIGTLAIPGVGPFIAAGPIMGTLAGAGVGGAVGGVAGALVGLGIPEYEATRFEDRLSSGGVLVAVHVDNDECAERAEKVLKQCGCEDVSRRGDSMSGKATKSTSTYPHSQTQL